MAKNNAKRNKHGFPVSDHAILKTKKTKANKKKVDAVKAVNADNKRLAAENDDLKKQIADMKAAAAAKSKAAK